MNLVPQQTATFLNLLIYVIIRAPHGHRSRTVAVVEDRKGPLEITLLTGALFGTTLLPLVWVISGFPSFANYPLPPVVFWLGVIVMIIGHWLFYRSHADLGTNWSISLQMRGNHALVTTGIFRRIRHPMYAAMFVQGIAQLLILSNWIVGPAWLITFGLLYLLRVGREEQMMLDRFGDDYRAYMSTTGRLLPRLRRKNCELEDRDV